MLHNHEQCKFHFHQFQNHFHFNFFSSKLEKKRNEFRKYLEQTGAIDNLTKSLIKLYEQQNKPSDAVKFLRKNMCESCPDDEEFEILQADLERANKKICDLERELSWLKGSIKRSASEVDLALTKGFEDLNSNAETSGLLKKLLTKDVIDQLKDQKTMFKGTLLDCIQSGLEMLGSPVGVFACDPDAYHVFASLFDPLIQELHGFKLDDKQPALDWGESCKFPDIDSTGDKIISIRIHCCRSMADYPLAPIMTLEHYEGVMGEFQSVTRTFTGDMMGKFHPLEGMEEDLKKSLIAENLLFKSCKNELKAANAMRFWPTGRGVFLNDEKTFAIWCNEEDHLRFISTELGGNLRKRNLFVIIFLSSDFSLFRRRLRSSDYRCHSSLGEHSFRPR